LNPYENFFGEVPAIAPMEEDLHPVEPGIVFISYYLYFRL